MTTLADPRLVALAKATAIAHNLDPLLICALVEQESGWNPWAIRYEPAFYQRYIVPLNLGQTEGRARAFSWGLTQCMGQTAREHGYKGNLAQLCEPATGLEMGCIVLANKLLNAANNVTEGLLYYNGGGNLEYPDQVQARMGRYA